MVKHNNSVPNIHLRKHWQFRTKCHFDQPAKKLVRRQKRAAKAAAMAPRPVQAKGPRGMADLVQAIERRTCKGEAFENRR